MLIFALQHKLFKELLSFRHLCFMSNSLACASGRGKVNSLISGFWCHILHMVFLWNFQQIIQWNHNFIFFSYYVTFKSLWISNEVCLCKLVLAWKQDLSHQFEVSNILKCSCSVNGKKAAWKFAIDNSKALSCGKYFKISCWNSWYVFTK